MLRADRVDIAPTRLRVHPALAARGHSGLTAREVATVQGLAVAPLLLERQGVTTEDAAQQLGLSVSALRAQLATLRVLGVVAESASGRWYLLDIGALALQPPTVAPQQPAGRALTLVTSPA